MSLAGEEIPARIHNIWGQDLQCAFSSLTILFMARKPRLELPDAVYHVATRGNAGASVFLADTDRDLFLSGLESVVERYGWICHAYCLMNNHYHLVIETPHPNLSRGMRQLNGVYTQRFNRKHNRNGHVFSGRFKSILLEKEAYLLKAACHVVVNPVRTKTVSDPSQWEWSSYKATAGIAPATGGLSVNWILSQFATDKLKAQLQYKDYVIDQIDNPLWDKVCGGLLLGGDTFCQRISALLANSSTMPKRRLYNRPSLPHLFADIYDKADRNRAACDAHILHGYTLSEIGKYLHLHYSSISRIVQKQRNLSNPKVMH